MSSAKYNPGADGDKSQRAVEDNGAGWPKESGA